MPTTAATLFLSSIDFLMGTKQSSIITEKKPNKNFPFIDVMCVKILVYVWSTTGL